MQKTAILTDIEHSIENLNPADQLKLLEKMIRLIKRSFVGQSPVRRKNGVVSGKTDSLRGALKQYANPSLIKHESTAFAQAMKGKHAAR
jgi:hypothetical protein